MIKGWIDRVKLWYKQKTCDHIYKEEGVKNVGYGIFELTCCLCGDSTNCIVTKTGIPPIKGWKTKQIPSEDWVNMHRTGR